MSKIIQIAVSSEGENKLPVLVGLDENGNTWTIIDPPEEKAQWTFLTSSPEKG